MPDARPPLRFAAFVMNTASHIQHGLWRHRSARQHEFDDVELWVDLAKTPSAAASTRCSSPTWSASTARATAPTT